MRTISYFKKSNRNEVFNNLHSHFKLEFKIKFNSRTLERNHILIFSRKMITAKFTIIMINGINFLTGKLKHEY